MCIFTIGTNNCSTIGQLFNSSNTDPKALLNSKFVLRNFVSKPTQIKCHNTTLDILEELTRMPRYSHMEKYTMEHYTSLIHPTGFKQNSSIMGTFAMWVWSATLVYCSLCINLAFYLFSAGDVLIKWHGSTPHKILLHIIYVFINIIFISLVCVSVCAYVSNRREGFRGRDY